MIHLFVVYGFQCDHKSKKNYPILGKSVAKLKYLQKTKFESQIDLRQTTFEI